MLCSFPPGKSTSNWLERLRTTRGFPTSSGIDLDHFLTSPPNQDSSVPSPAPDPSTSEPAPPSRCLTTSQSSAGDGNSDKEWYGIMNNVLSELFIMGDQRPCPSKKSSRKQRNPRFCPNFAKKDETAIIATVSVNSHSKSPEKTANGDNVGLADEEEEVEEEEEEELVGYSRSEVTVIDTSCAEWKFEKLLFRRKSVWKARDRKGKSRGGPGKKKKKNKRKLAADEDAIVHGKKKHKISNSELVSLKEGLGNPNGSTLVCKNSKMVHNPTQGSNIRFLGSEPPKNTEKKKLKL